MKVPVIDSPRAQLQGEAMPNSGGLSIRADTSLAQGLAGLGQGMRQFGEALSREEERASREANALVVAESDLELERRYQKHMAGDPENEDPGFLGQRGKDAFSQSAQVLDTMEGDRQEIADGISDPNARNQFLIRSAEKLSNYSRQVEQHTSKEFETARSETLQGLSAVHLGMSESGIVDLEAWKASKLNVEEHILALSRTPEAGQAAVKLFRSLDAFAFTTGLVASGDIEGAGTFLENNRSELGGKYVEAAKLVAAASVKSEAEQAAGAVVENATQPDGYLDGPKALAEVAGLTGTTRSLANSIVRAQVAADGKRKADDTAKLKNEAARQMLNSKNGFAGINPTLLEKLESDTYKQTDYVRRLKADDDARVRRMLQRAKGGASQKAADKAQATADRMALKRYSVLTRVEQSRTDPVGFVAGMGVSPEGLLNIQMKQTKAIEYVNNGTASDADEFTRQVERVGKEKGIFAKGKSQGLDAKVQGYFREAAQTRWDDFVRTHGKAPTLEEQRTELLDPLMQDAMVNKEGLLRLFDEVEEIPLYEAMGTGRQVVDKDGVPVKTAAPPPAVKPPPAAKALPPPTAKQKAAAMEWLKTNSTHPSAAEVRRRMGIP